MDEKLLDAYQIDAAKVLAELHTTDAGLSDTEATERLTKHGPNKLAVVRRTPLIVTFLHQFKDAMIILLIAAYAFSVYLHDFRTSTVLGVLIVVNALIGFSQEYKAESVMESLKRLVVPMARVKRGGTLKEVSSEELVPGDVVYIEEGNSVPADLRLLEEMELASNDFALTGESNPSRKFTHAIKGTVPLANRHNLVFMGTTIASGQGYGVVIGTGMRTELGRIANLSQSTASDLSPLQREMAHVAKRITQGTLFIAVPLTVIAWLNNFGVHDSFIFAIGIASAMIPEGLPSEVNISLAQAASKLAHARALVKKLSAVETLGAANLICTDKTGTLTKNEMTVEQVTIGLQPYYVSGTGYEANGSILDAKKRPLDAGELRGLQLFFTTGVMASNASVSPPDDQHPDWYVLGDPTEGSLIVLARKAGLDDAGLNKDSRELREFPFDSVRKMMSSVRQYEGRLTLFAKGAPTEVLKNCDFIMDGGHIRKLTAKDRALIQKRDDELASHAMRNLAFAYRLLPANTKSEALKMAAAESGLVYLGMASMIDPPRDEVFDAMQSAHTAGIPVTIITGDNPLTATAIALKVGLAKAPEELTIISGNDLHELSDAKILRLIDRGQVIFSRVAPEDKLRIVDIAKAAHKVVAVTGDGINDAPALKRADIGVAMGRTGTDVAKQSADIILLDDSFSTLIGAIRQGRIIFQNIRKSTICAISSNGGELVVVLLSLAAQAIFHVPLAILAVQILAIDLMAELFPIAALGWDPAEHELMNDKPRNIRAHILSTPVIFDLVRTGLIMGGLAYANYLFFIWRHGYTPGSFDKTLAIYGSATALTYITICMCQFANIFLRRVSPGTSVFSKYLWSNKQLLIAFGISLFGIINIVYNPWLQPFFGTHALGLVDWLCALAAGFIYLFWRQGTSLSSHRKRTRAQLAEQVTI